MLAPDDSQLLADLARSYGIADHYYDIWGQRHEPSPDTLRAVLEAMGVATASREDVTEGLAALHARYWCRVCDAVMVVRQEESSAWSLRVPSCEEEDGGWSINWTLYREGGPVQDRGEAGPGLAVKEQVSVGDERYIRLLVDVPLGLAPGYYRFVVRVGRGTREFRGMSMLVVAPATCFIPAAVLHHERIWGLWVQLYAIRSHRNWGAGDFTDLASLVRWAGQDLGAGAVGVNPLHALKNRRPYHISPYSPQSRGFLNELYLDIERIPEYGRSHEAQRLVESDTFKARLNGFRSSEWVDYEGLHRAKLEVLELLYRQFSGEGDERRLSADSDVAQRQQAFEQFCQDKGEALEQYALYLALAERFEQATPPMWTWREWPVEFRHPTSPVVAEFRTHHRDRLRFYQYIQWQAAEQLAAVTQATREAGMPIGLYHDFALGSDPHGAEGWLLQDVLAHAADCGCPPDAFALQGQNWGFPPFDPVKLRAQAYRPFIELLRQNLPRGGAIRLDHVMGLFRLFWIPKGQAPSAGAYVQYPYDDLLGILALESQRAQTLVIGEDLGTVPDWVREKLAAVRAFSYRVWYFERNADGSWKSPDQYPADSLAVTTTHDLPTLHGFWGHDDLMMREGLGLFPSESTRQQAWEERRRDKERMLEALRAHGGWSGPERDAADGSGVSMPLSEAVHRFLARTASRVVLASLDDWVGERAQANVPGTVAEYPNWSRKMVQSLESIERDAGCARLARVMNDERRSTHRIDNRRSHDD